MTRLNSTQWTLRLMIAAGTLALAGLAAAADSGITGFGGEGTGWKVNGDSVTTSPFPKADVLQLTDNKNKEIRTAFFATPVEVISGDKGFTATFTYTASGAKAADGFAFVLQQDSRGAEAIGGEGGGLGYYGMQPSVAFEVNLYTGNSPDFPDQKRGVNWVNNEWGKYTKLEHVDVGSGNPIEITLTYDPAKTTFTAKLKDATANTEDTYTSTSLDVEKILGDKKAYVGFTAATGGAASTQQISNFSFKITGSESAAK